MANAGRRAGPPEPPSRHLDVGGISKKRRRQRKWVAKDRSQNQGEREDDDRVGSRHRILSCCGKRRRSCHCDDEMTDDGVGLALRDWMDRQAVEKIVRETKAGALQTVYDTADTGWFVEAFARPADCRT